MPSIVPFLLDSRENRRPPPPYEGKGSYFLPLSDITIGRGTMTNLLDKPPIVWHVYTMVPT